MAINMKKVTSRVRDEIQEAKKRLNEGKGPRVSQEEANAALQKRIAEREAQYTENKKTGQSPFRSREEALTALQQQKQQKQQSTVQKSTRPAPTAAAVTKPTLAAVGPAKPEDAKAVTDWYNQNSEKAKKSAWEKSQKEYTSAENEMKRWKAQDELIRAAEDAWAAFDAGQQLTYEQQKARDEWDYDGGREELAALRQETDAEMNRLQGVMDANRDSYVNGYDSIENERAERYKGVVSDVEASAAQMIGSGRMGEWSQLWQQEMAAKTSKRDELAADLNVLKSSGADRDVIAEQEERLQWLEQDIQALTDVSVLAQPDYEKMSQPSGGEKDLLHMLVNSGQEPAWATMNGAAGYDATSDLQARVQMMTDEEKGIYNYLYNTGGENGAKNAREYLERISTRLTYRAAKQREEDVAALADQMPVMSTVARTVMMPMEASAGLGLVLAGATGNKVNPYNSGLNVVRDRETIYETVNDKIGNPVGQFAYGVGTSMADVGMAALLSGGSGGVASMLMSLPAGASTAHGMLERGADMGTAVLGGTAAAGTEWLTEKLGFDRLYGSFTAGKMAGSYKDMLKAALTGFFAEGSEEAVSAFADEYIDRYMMGNNSQRMQMIRQGVDSGLSVDEAIREADWAFVKTLAENFLAGGVSGGLMQGGAYAGGRMNADAATREIITQLPGLDQNLVQAAMEMEAGVRTRDEATVEEAYAQIEAEQEKQAEKQNHAVFEAPAVANGVQGLIAGVQKSGADAQVIVKQNGKEATVPLKDVKFENEEQRQAYGFAAAYADADTARQFLAGYERTNAPIYNYAKGFSAAYVAGRNGRDLVGAEKVWAKAVPDAIREMAYEAGRKSVQQEEVRLDMDPEVDSSIRKRVHSMPRLVTADYSGGVNQVRRSAISKSQAVQMAMLDSLGKKYGTQYIFVDSFQESQAANRHLGLDAASMQNGLVNGIYKAGTNQMVIALDAEGGNLLRAAGHESWHYIKEHSQENDYVRGDAEALQTFVLDKLQAVEGYDLETRIAEKQDQYRVMAGQELDRNEAVEEIVADSLVEVLATEENVRDLMENHTTLGEKVMGFVKRFLADIRETLRNLTGKNAEARAMLEQDEKTLQQIAEHFDRVMIEVNAVRGSMEPQVEAGVKYAFMDNIGRSYEEQWREYKSGKSRRDRGLVLNAYEPAISDGAEYWTLPTRVITKGQRMDNQTSRSAHALSDQVFADMENDLNDSDFVIVDHTDGTVAALKNKGGQVIIYAGKHAEREGYSTIEATTVHERNDPRPMLRSKIESGNDIELYFRKKGKLHKMTGGTIPLYAVSTMERALNLSQESTTVKNKFSIAEDVESAGELVAVHNLNERKLRETLELGGFPMPSIAIVKAKGGHDTFGDISVVFGRETIDPKASTKNRVYGNDAWTPIFPAVETEVDYDRVIELRSQEGERMMAVDEGLARDVRSFYNRLAGDDITTESIASMADNAWRSAGMLASYMEDTGRPYEIKTIEVKEQLGFKMELARVYDMIIDAFGGKVDVSGMPGHEVVSTYGEMLAQKDETFQFLFEDYNNGHKKSGIQLLNLIREAKRYDEAGRTEKTTTHTENDYKATADALRKTINREDFDSWFEEKVEGVFGRKGIYNGKERFTPMGNRKSFKQLHDDVTAENVLRAMLRNPETDKPATDADGLKAAAATRYKSIEEVRRDANRLRKVPEEEYRAIMATADNELRDFLNAIEAWDYDVHEEAGNLLVKAAKNRMDADAIVDLFKRNGFRKIKKADAKKAADLIKRLQNIPTEYFEAKPSRVVAFSEIRKVILPDNVSAGITKQLEKRGIAYELYDGTDEDRLAKLNALQDVRFSLRDVDATNTTMETLLEENRALRDTVRALHQQLKGEPGQLTEKTVRKVANGLKKKYASSVPLNTLAENLTRAFNAMQSAENTRQSEAAMQMMGHIALDMVQKSQIANREAYDASRDLRERFRKNRIGLTDTQWQEAENLFDTARNFRRAVFGKWNVPAQNGRDVTTLDMIWPELVEEYPQYFSADASEGDMVQQVLGMLEATAIKYDNPFGAEIEQVASSVAAEIYQEYLTEGREAGGKDAAVDRLMDQLADAKKTILEQKRGLRKANRDMADMSAKREAQALRRKQNQDYNQVKNEIIRKKGQMLKKLEAPKSGAFIPQSMHSAVLELLRAIDFEGKLEAGTNRPLTATMMQKARDEYAKLNLPDENGGTGPLAAFYNGDLVSDFDMLAREADGLRAKELSMRHMQALRNIVAGYAAAIINEDRLFMQNRRESLQETGDDLLLSMSTNKEHTVQGKVREWFSKGLQQGLLKPVTVFHQFKGTAMEPIWKALRNAEGKHIRHVEEATAYLEEALGKYDQHKSIKEEGSRAKRDKAKEITFDNGTKMKLTDQELMTLYATARREKLVGTQHLEKGGFTLANAPKGSSMRPVVLSARDIQTINSSLTQKQREYVDHMVSYLSGTCADWGNEVTMELYGVEKFHEDYYIPFSVNKNYVKVEPATEQDSRIKTGSFTKALTANASNPLEIKPFTEVWCQHAEKMSDYNAFVLPIEDMTRLMNYKGDGDGVKSAMNRAYGKQTTDYIMHFLRRLNGNSRNEMGENWLGGFMGRAKGAAVTFNLSVAIQQAGSAPRAMAMIDPRYFMAGLAKAVAHGKVDNHRAIGAAYAELEKYAPIAVEKGWGYFDTNMSRGMYQRAQNTAMNRINDAGGKLAEWGDKITWAIIWEAVKSETTDTYKEVMVGSDEYFQLCADRFQDVIDHTQVVDSIFQRAEFAAEKGMMKNFMAFMSEPLTTYNMMYRAIYDVSRAKNKTAKNRAMLGFGRTFAAFAVSSAVTAALKSFVMALRDRDNEKKDEEGNIIGVRDYWDKYQDSLPGAVMDNLLGVGTVFTNAISDAMSGFGGGGDLTTGWIGNLYTGGKQMIDMLTGNRDSSLENWEKAMYKMLQGSSSAVGIGFGNFWRDVKSIGLTAYEVVERDSLAGTAWDKTQPFATRLEAAKKNYVYKKQGDGRKVNTGIYYDLMLTAYFEEGGMSGNFEAAADAAIESGATYKGLVTAFKTRLRVAEERIPQAAASLVDGDMDTYQECVEDLQGAGVGLRPISSMILAEVKELLPKDEEDPGTGASVVSEMKRKDVDEDPVNYLMNRTYNEATTPQELKEAIDTMRENGYTDKELRTKVTTSYRAEYCLAMWNGDAAAAKNAADMMKGAGVGITDDDLVDWTSGLTSSYASDTLHNMIKKGDGKTAVKIRAAMYKAHGQAETNKAIETYVKKYCVGKEDVSEYNVRLALQALGYSQATIDSWYKK
ncbi:MAG: hypothetical protein J6K73_05290 [Clostridia bacterium]|nr:hypothetical protein [Clostridia bacterium]